MFENVIGQDDAVGMLKADLGASGLPPSMLFEGPRLSAKASAALELGRVLSCANGAAWNCSCPDCARHRSLSHPDMLLFGPKNLWQEAAAGAELLSRSPGTASRYFFVRAVRKLTRRFDAALYADEEGRLSKALPLVRSLLEGSDACLPGSSTDDEAAKEAHKLLSTYGKLHELLPDSTPVFQIRAMEAWARQTPMGRAKIVILEHADRMLDASRNALLKILEEAPPRTTFVLTSSRRQALIPTILSRVRPYRFRARSQGAATAVLERVFRWSDPGARSVENFLDRYRPESAGHLSAAAVEFASALLGEWSSRFGGDPAMDRAASDAEGGVRTALAKAAAASSNFGAGDDAQAWSFPAFLDEAGSVFARLLREADSAEPSMRAAERWAELSRDAIQRHTFFNLNPVAVAERLAAAMIADRP